MLHKRLVKELDPGYSVEVDRVDKETWHRLLTQFDDASFYQTWSFGAIHSGERKLSHFILKKDGSIVSMVEVRIVRLPFVPMGVAYINWGPMWKATGQEPDPTHFRNVIRGLYGEYVRRRGLFLRILPKVPERNGGEANIIRSIFKEEGYTWSPDPLETVILDLSPPLETLRQNLNRSWKRSLKDAQEQNFAFIEGDGDEVCKQVLKVAKEMKDRKQFIGSDQEELIAIHKHLPDHLKLKMIVCLWDKETVAALGWPSIGKVGFPLVGGTGDKAIKLKASFALWWKMVEYYKQQGFTMLDTAGVNASRNPGGYVFKTGLLGKNFKEPDHFIGKFDACENLLSLVIFTMGNSLREVYNAARVKSTELSKQINTWRSNRKSKIAKDSLTEDIDFKMVSTTSLTLNRGVNERRQNLLRVGKSEIVVTGKFLRIARIREEWLDAVEDPDSIIKELKSNRFTDLFTFWQKVPEKEPKYSYYMEWDNLAAIRLTSYENWFKNQIDVESRNAVIKAAKKGVEVRLTSFSDEFMEGVANIFNQSRNGRSALFACYGKDMEALKEEYYTLLHRTDLIGAYYGDELIGFIQQIYSGKCAYPFGMMSKIEHQDKFPTNALLAKAVEVCCQKKFSYLVYGKFDYGQGRSKNLSRFKLKNAFERFDIPRYYVPLTLKGEIALRARRYY